MKRVESFILHSDDYEFMVDLNYVQLGKLFEALMLHARDEDDYVKLRSMDRRTLQLYVLIADQMDKDWEKYRRRVLLENMRKGEG